MSLPLDQLWFWIILLLASPYILTAVIVALTMIAGVLISIPMAVSNILGASENLEHETRSEGDIE